MDGLPCKFTYCQFTQPLNSGAYPGGQICLQICQVLRHRSEEESNNEQCDLEGEKAAAFPGPRSILSHFIFYLGCRHINTEHIRPLLGVE